MNFHLPMPMFVKRWLAQRNPWLLSDHGTVSTNRTLRLGPLEIDIIHSTRLMDEDKERLRAERDGTS